MACILNGRGPIRLKGTRRATISGIVGIVLLIIFLWSVLYGQTAGSIRLISLAPGSVETSEAGFDLVPLTIIGQGFAPDQNLRVWAGYTPGATQFVLWDLSYVLPDRITANLTDEMLRVPGILYITAHTPSTGYSNSLPLSVVRTPVLTGMVPAIAPPGTTFVARINGQKLSGLDSVNFSVPGITARLLGGGADWSRFAEITVASSVTSGSYGITVSTLGRTASMANLLTIKSSQTTTTPSVQPLPFPDVETGPIKTGYVVVTADDPQGADPLVSMNVGIVRNGVVQSQAAIAGASGAAVRATLGIDIDPDLGRNFGIAILNAGQGPSSVHLTLLDERGVSISQTKTISFGEFTQISSFVNELFPSGALGTSFRGSLIISSSQSFIPLGLRFNGPYFFPVPAGGASTAVMGTPLRTNPFAEFPRVTVFPQFALGGGWATQLSLVDAKGISATGRIAFFDNAGQPTVVTMNGETESVFRYTVPPNGSFLLAPRDANGQTPF